MPAAAGRDFSAEAVLEALGTKAHVIGRELLSFDRLDSTNTRAALLARGGCPEGTVIVAGHQTAGRGRAGRVWYSPPGENLYFSIILRPPLPVSRAPVLTLMSAVACSRALRFVSGVPVSIKWPNDLVAGDRKLGGILTELSAVRERIQHAVIGIGVNVNLLVRETPDSIRSTVTSLREELGYPLARTAVLTELLAELDRWYTILLSEGSGPVLAQWTMLTTTIGRSVVVTVPGGELRGTAEGIDSEGRLILRLPDGSMNPVSAGDVTVLRHSNP